MPEFKATTNTTTAPKKFLTDYVSVRIRLSDAERLALKTAYQRRVIQDSQVSTARINPTSTISVETKGAQADVHNELQISGVVIADLLHTRETLALPIIVKLQNVLGVQIVDRQRLMNAMEDYIDYVMNPDLQIGQARQRAERV